MTTENNQVLESIEAVKPSAETQTPADDALSTEVAQPKEESQEPAKAPSEADRALAAKQRRIDRLTRERYEERGQFQQRLADLEARVQPREQQADPQAQQQLTQQDIDKFVEARATEKASAQLFNAKCNDIVAQGTKTLGKDFTASITVLNEEGALFTAANKATPLLEAVMDSDEPAKLLHYLGQNPEVAAELADLSPLRQAKRIGQIETDLAPKSREPSKAPRPLEPVKSSASSEDEPDQNDTSKWIAWSMRQDAKKRKR